VGSVWSRRDDVSGEAVRMGGRLFRAFALSRSDRRHAPSLRQCVISVSYKQQIQ
jgi:hypothetical protein